MVSKTDVLVTNETLSAGTQTEDQSGNTGSNDNLLLYKVRCLEKELEISNNKLTKSQKSLCNNVSVQTNNDIKSVHLNKVDGKIK